MSFIQVANPVFKDAKLGKHTRYEVSGADEKGDFMCMRRYKEFDALRKALQRRWPGCLVPAIPSKQVIGNLDQGFVNTRMKLLNNFLKKIMQIPYIYDCEEFQTFIRVQTDYSKLVNDFKEKPSVILAENYQELFQEFIFTHSSQQDSDKLMQTWLDNLNIFLDSLEQLEKYCKTVLDNFGIFESEINNMVSGLNEITEFYSKTYEFKSTEITKRPAFNNHYSILLDWCQLLILEVKSFIDLIFKRNSLMRTRNKQRERYDEELKSLEEKKQGKKKFSQIFSKGNKEERIAKQEKIISEVEIELKAYELICKIVDEKTISSDIPLFKKSVEENFRYVLDTFVKCSSEEFDEIFMQFRPLQQVYDENFT